MFHFRSESEAAHVGRPGDLRPGRRFFGDHQIRRETTRRRRSLSARKEFDCFEVFLAAIAVRYPLAFAPAIVEIQHRGDGVGAQAVHVVFIKPKQGVADEEVADFVAAVIENECVPVRMLALPRVGVLVEMGAVEIA